MNTMTIFALGNKFEYNDTELKINGVIQTEDKHESFNDFLQACLNKNGVFDERGFCKLFGMDADREEKLNKLEQM